MRLDEGRLRRLNAIDVPSGGFGSTVVNHDLAVRLQIDVESYAAAAQFDKMFDAMIEAEVEMDKWIIVSRGLKVVVYFANHKDRMTFQMFMPSNIA